MILFILQQMNALREDIQTYRELYVINPNEDYLMEAAIAAENLNDKQIFIIRKLCKMVIAGSSWKTVCIRESKLILRELQKKFKNPSLALVWRRPP